MLSRRTYRLRRFGARPFLNTGIVLWCALGEPAASQASAQPPTNEKPRRVSLSYFGDAVVRPGARLAYEGAMYVSGPHQLIILASIGGYSTAPGYALFIALGGGYRAASASGWFFDVQVAIGYNAINRPGVVENNADGIPVSLPPMVANHFMPLGMAGPGYDFYPLFKLPVSVFAHAGGYGLTGSGEPFSGGYLLDVGLAYRFGTGRASTAPLPVVAVPPAEAPSNLDSPLRPTPIPTLAPNPAIQTAPQIQPSPPIPPAQPETVAPRPSLFPPDSPTPPLDPNKPPEQPVVPALPPPPTL